MTCNELQQDLALTAANSIDQARLAFVHDHVRSCPECAARLKEYESICAAHTAAIAELDGFRTGYTAKAATRVHDRVSANAPWRWLVPVAGAGAVAVMVLLTRPPRTDPVPSPVTSAVRSEPTRTPAGIGTLARYRQALDQRGENSLDSLLAQDADSLLRAPSPNELEQLRRDVF